MSNRKETRHSMCVSIEFEDNNYTYISSAYPWKSLQGDVEQTKVPVKVIMKSAPTALCRAKVSSFI